MTDIGVVRERRGPVLILRLDRPEVRNALTPAMRNHIGAAVADAEDDADIRVVVLTGTGDRAFCAGEDLRAFADDDRGRAGDEKGLANYLRLLDGEVSVPVVGAANGTAVAGGLELLFSCDVIVASSEAQFGLPEVKRGLFAGTGVMSIATRVPLGVALELALTGDVVDANRAYELGLVNTVVPPRDVLATALDYADRIAANGPLAITATKELVRMAAGGAPGASDRLAYWRTVVFGSHDAKEGATAFIEKRPPMWKGR
jgi:enoyl-CoA hydratase/carnithine racemase